MTTTTSRRAPMRRVESRISAPQKALPRHVKDLNGHKIHLNTSKTLEEANKHKQFVAFGIDASPDLPMFDDSSKYGLSETEFKRLLEKEVNRMEKAATTADFGLFESKGLLEFIDQTSFTSLTEVAEQIICNLHIITLDNGIMILESCPEAELVKLACAEIKQSHSRLKLRYTDSARKSAQTSSSLQPSRPKRQLYFAVVDYITSCLCRLLIRTVANDFWNEKTFAVLATMTVKMKFLSKDPSFYATKATSDAEEAVSNFNEEYSELSFRISSGGEPTDKEFDIGQEHSLDEVYYVANMGIRHCITKLLSILTGSVDSRPSVGRGYDDNQYCTFMHEIGLDGSVAVVTEDNKGGVATTSNLSNIRICCQALELTKTTFNKLKESTRPPNTASGLSRNKASFEVTLLSDPDSADNIAQNEKFNGSLFHTTSMDDWISLLVPLSLSDPIITDLIEDLIHFVYNTSGEDEVIQKLRGCRFAAARCTMQTDSFKERQNRMLDQDPDVIGMVQSKLERRLRAGTRIGPAWDKSLSVNDVGFTDDFGQEGLKLQRENAQKMRSWVFTATSVTVRCREYILSVLAVCLFIVLGGLAVPFTVQDRLPGVDPFNITMFVWLIVGTILIAAKGRYVKEWPWNDFIHGRVVCTSVSDLAEVSGIDRQTVLMKLLNDEKAIKLATTGPYNGMFGSKAENETEAFSIDEPTKISTMLATGFIVLKVLSEHGEHLICLDARQNSDMDYAGTTGDNLRYLSCRNLSSLHEENSGGYGVGENIEGMKRILYLRKQRLGWKRVLEKLSKPTYICRTAFSALLFLYFSLQFVELYENDIIPYESRRSELSPVASFVTRTGIAAHKWHVTRIALIFIYTLNGNEDVFKGVIQLDPEDKEIYKGLRILMTRDEEIPPGQAEEKLGLGQILSEVFYIVTYTWGVFLDEAETHLQVLSKKCVEEDLSSAEQLRYTRELHQITPLWVQVRRRLASARDAAMQMTVHPFFVAINAQEAIESYLKKHTGVLDDHIKRSEELTNQTNVLISLIFNIATLQDTRAAMEESKAAHKLSASVHRVALLTFFYLPLTLAAGIYGMNIRHITGEAAQGHIVNFVILSVCLMAATIGAWFTWSKNLTSWVEYRSKLLFNIRASRV